MNRKNILRRVIASALMMVMLAAWPARAASTAAMNEAAVTYSEVTLTKGSITRNVIATGSLRFEKEESLTLPEALTIKSIDVEVGESFTRGQILAHYDTEALKDSLKEAEDALIAQNELITGLIMKQSSEQSIKSAIGGVVKQLNLEVGQSVQQALGERPAALISSNGLMQVRITPAQPLSLGQEVKIRVGTQTQTGSVARLPPDGSALITFPDTKAEIDELVQVSFNEFNIGEGKAQVNLPYHLFTLTDGVVDSAPLQINSVIRPGSIIYKIKNTSPSSDYDDALEKREELYYQVQLYKELMAEPVFVAFKDGIAAFVTAQEKIALPKDAELLSMFIPDSFLLDVSVDELDILTVQPGQEGLATLDALPQDSFPVQVKKMNLLGQSVGGITGYTVTLSLPGDERLRSGMNGTVTLKVGETMDSVLLPLSALMSDRGGSYVYLKGAGKSADGSPGVKTYIELGLSDTDYAAVISGLTENDVVLVRDTALQDNRTMRGPSFLNPDAPAGDSPGGRRR